MKTLILLLLLFLSIIVKGQNEIDTTINNICKERGHVLSELNTEINKYCKEETEKELSWQNIVDYFPPKFIRLYMKVKMKIKKRLAI